MIPDGSISATNSDPSYAATKVRMSDPSAWCLPDGQSGSPNLEIDFGENVLVCAVETRGYDSGDGLYAQEFELSFAANGGGFAKYTEDGGTRVRAYCFPLVFRTINQYSRTPVTRTLQGNEKQFELAVFRVIEVD